MTKPTRKRFSSLTRRLAVLTVAVAILPAATAEAAKPRAGKYEGKVAAGFGGPQMSFAVKGGKVKDVLARIFQSCGGGPQQQAIVAPSKSFKVSKKGRFSGKATETIPDVGSETVWIKGRFTSPTRVKGTIRSQSTGSGSTCDTLERKFDLKLAR